MRECNRCEGECPDIDDLKFGGWLRAKPISRSNSGGSFKSDGSFFKASKSDGGVFGASKADGGHASFAGTSGVSVGTNSGGDQVATERDAEKLTVADSVSTNLKVAEIGSIPVVIRDMGVAVGEAILVEEVSKGAADVSLPGDSNTVCGIGSVVSSNSFGLPNAWGHPTAPLLVIGQGGAIKDQFSVEIDNGMSPLPLVEVASLRSSHLRRRRASSCDEGEALPLHPYQQVKPVEALRFP
ncbi:hypothetical protein ACOSP7_001791 [Xanthoceras sorbifolium]